MAHAKEFDNLNFGSAKLAPKLQFLNVGRQVANAFEF